MVRPVTSHPLFVETKRERKELFTQRDVSLK